MNAFLERLIEQAAANPYSTLGSSSDPYMERGWLKNFTKDEPMSIRLHHTLRSDSDRALHDHPWENVSIIVAGECIEVMPEDQNQPCMMDTNHYVRVWRRPGDVVVRKATDRHRLIIPEGGAGMWSIFMMGIKVQSWGFYDPHLGKKVYWKDYLKLPEGTEPVSLNEGREVGT